MALHQLRKSLMIDIRNILMYSTPKSKFYRCASTLKCCPSFQQKSVTNVLNSGVIKFQNYKQVSSIVCRKSVNQCATNCAFSTSSKSLSQLDKIGNVEDTRQSLFGFLSLRSFLDTPTPFMLYGISGLIPFVSVPLYMWATSTYIPALAHTQLVYGACILSFLGGVAWGNELKHPQISDLKSLGYSIFLPLVSWLGVLAHPSVLSFPIMISGIVYAGFVDTNASDYPRWFKNLRFLLSLLVALSLTSTFIFRFTKSRSGKVVEEDQISDKEQ